MNLDDLRREIDAVDDKLAEFFARRMHLALGVAAYKKENNLPVLNIQRENEILQKRAGRAEPLLESYTRDFFSNLFELSRSLQNDFLSGKRGGADICGASRAEPPLEAKENTFGLIGADLSYSLSKRIHETLGDYGYALFSKTAEEFEEYMNAGDFDGLNVTNPYKKAVIPYCGELSGIAREIGAVNTLYRKDGKLIGTNTDYDGFLYVLKKSKISLKNKKVLILGRGGTSLTVQKCARDEGASEIITTGRNHDFSKAHDAQIIVNATPVGTFPDNGEKIIDLESFPKCEGVIDVIYNPLLTDLLLRARERGIPYSNGLPMLVAQATAAAGFFTGKDYSSQNEAILSGLLAETRNIVLIGMPGAGKTAVGGCVAEMTGREFVDLDDVIVKNSNMSIPDIFAKYGEAVFRDMETRAAKEHGKRARLVIAAGGGVVLRKENMDALTQNGVVFFLDRDTGKLATAGRPLSTDADALERMYGERRPLYEKYSDYTIDCIGGIAENAEKIFREIVCNC